MKCDHIPRRVPGLPHTRLSDRRRARILIRTGPSRRYGESLTPSATATIRTMPSDDARANVLVQPSSWRAKANGAAAMIAPIWPTWPVIWVTTGAWRTRNHSATSRITLTKIVASPAPSTALASTATGNDVAYANISCPSDISASPASSSTRDPYRSSSTPIGICSPAYTISWSTTKNDSWAAEIPNRSWASNPATPSELRLKTASR